MMDAASGIPIEPYRRTDSTLHRTHPTFHSAQLTSHRTDPTFHCRRSVSALRTGPG